MSLLLGHHKIFVVLFYENDFLESEEKTVSNQIVLQTALYKIIFPTVLQKKSLCILSLYKNIN